MLGKSGTTESMVNSRVMPLEPFHELFYTRGENEKLCIDKLRQKIITLLAFALMLRASDLAPKWVVFDSVNPTNEKLVLKRNQINFEDEGSLTVKFLGTKQMIQIEMDFWSPSPQSLIHF